MSGPDEPECLGVCTFEDDVCIACGREVLERTRERVVLTSEVPLMDSHRLETV